MAVMAARRDGRKKPRKGDWGTELQAKRLEKDLSQDEAAAYLEIPVSTLRGWEQGRHEPAPYVRRFVMRLLEKYG